MNKVVPTEEDAVNDLASAAINSSDDNGVAVNENHEERNIITHAVGGGNGDAASTSVEASPPADQQLATLSAATEVEGGQPPTANGGDEGASDPSNNKDGDIILDIESKHDEDNNEGAEDRGPSIIDSPIDPQKTPTPEISSKECLAEADNMPSKASNDSSVGIASAEAEISEMDHQHSCDGLRTFSLAHPYRDHLSENGAQRGDDAGRKGTEGISSSSSGEPAVPEETEEGDSEPPGAAFARRGTQKFVSRPSPERGVSDGEMASSSGKEAPFRVPQTMYMGHPVGTQAAEFLERHTHRVRDVKTTRKKVSSMLKSVMDHDPISSGSALPDIDSLFPVKGSEHDQGDVYH